MKKTISVNSQTVSLIEEKIPRKFLLEWSEKVKGDDSSVNHLDKFPHLLKFLLAKKRVIEYASCTLRSNTSQGGAHHLDRQSGEDKRGSVEELNSNVLCLIHAVNNHSTEKCRAFLSKDFKERVALLAEKRACFRCLRPHHRMKDCHSNIVCNMNGCTKPHNSTIHEAHEQGLILHTTDRSEEDSATCILQIMKVDVVSPNGETINILWDSGASLCLVTFTKAKKLKLMGKPTELSLVKVGGVTEKVQSFVYNVPLKDKHGRKHVIKAYGIEEISSQIKKVDIEGAICFFPDLRAEDIQRPSGFIDLLVGFNYANLHPVRKKAHGHLLVMENDFGKCLGGSHHNMKECTVNHLDQVLIHHVTMHTNALDDFMNSEGLGICCTPRCGSCRCGTCSLGGKNCTLKEEKEHQLIETNLVHKVDHWETKYPWIEDPQFLPNNRLAAEAMLFSTEQRLRRDPARAKTYQEQVVDMIERGVAVKLSKKEQSEYKGPVHYLPHHEVINENSKSTPLRIVFNASAKFHGKCLNDFWAKGPDLLNDQLGILLRFREHNIGIAGDIRKMYHAIKLSSGLERHTHRFLWRDLDLKRNPDIYTLTSVSFGDRPAGSIATTALMKTAEMGQITYPRAAEMVINNSYVDDLLDSFSDSQEARQVTKDVENMIRPGGFQMKQWVMTNEDIQSAYELHLTPTTVNDSSVMGVQKVLGLKWDVKEDVFKFQVKLNFSLKKRKVRSGPNLIKSDINELSQALLTKRQILSQINGFYDPLGLASPVTLRAKIMMAKLFRLENKHLDWDEPIPSNLCTEWLEYFQNLYDIEDISFQRCIQPKNIVGNPILVMFGDGSEDGFGCSAYARWKLIYDNKTEYESRLLAAKNRVAPKRKLTVPRLELNGALVSTRF